MGKIRVTTTKTVRVKKCRKSKQLKGKKSNNAKNRT